MPIVAASGNGSAPSVEKRNGGTVLNGGNIPAGSPMTESLSLATLADDFGKSFGSRVIAQVGTGSQYTDRVGISGARPGAIVDGSTVLGYNADFTEWVVKGGNVTKTLAGVANTTLIGGAAGPQPDRDSTYQLETTRTNGSLDLDVLARPSSGINSFRTISGGGVLKNYINPAVAGGATNSADSAANATRSVPGELVYRYGAALPKLDNYKAKDSAES
jgi:hypothetical protein